jgi:hypothetical protein
MQPKYWLDVDWYFEFVDYWMRWQFLCHFPLQWRAILTQHAIGPRDRLAAAFTPDFNETITSVSKN